MEYENIAKLFIEKPIAFRREFAIALGGIDESLYLQQLLYWSNKGEREDGWFYKTKEEIEEETTLTRFKQDRVRKKLEEKKLVETSLITVRNKPILHYKINLTRVSNLLMQYQETYQSNRKKLTNAKVRNSLNSITENTTENTTENIQASQLARGIEKIIFEMTKIDPKNKNYYGVKTQRQACQFLIEEYGLETVLASIEAIPTLKKKVSYFPSITTPCELRDKWVKVNDAVERHQLQNKPSRAIAI